MSSTQTINIEVTTTRKKIISIRDREGLSIAEISRQSGVNSGALSTYLNEKYTGDNTKIAEKLKSWLRLREAKEKAKNINLSLHVDGLVNTQQLLGGLELAQVSADMVAFYGGAGGGKSHAARQYQRDNSNVFIVTAEPALCSLSSVMQALCRAVGADEGTCATMSHNIVEALKNRNALLIIDEAHHLTPRILDQLRCIYDKINLGGNDFGVAYLGNEPLLKQLTSGLAMKQIQSRLGVCSELLPPPAADGPLLLSAIVERKLSIETEIKSSNWVAAIGGYRAIIKRVRRAAALTRKQIKDLSEKDICDANSH
ncbi:AAA family ATPase [Candidatus Persebacteraceae bacterium Df01]|jgi:hypothetical protein|uniref:AAA family ATPase n=1 Tax=Candidatus Doriopsillibacter californiensis TaxID=2970740 RepID=A0ABT7QMC9_9GAMM|nr:AAA family ATPase [Candidatus Persebacteraceae bacterium Df01]